MDKVCSSSGDSVIVKSSSDKKFFFANPRAQYLALKEEIDDAISSVLNSETYILGPQVELFEKEFATYLGVKYSVGVNSGTDALILSLRALNIGEGDEVIMTSFTAVATAAAVVSVGATPVYVDIDLSTYTLNPELLAFSLSPKTKAVILVHLYGHPGQVKEISNWCKAHSLFLIEDCAQAHGAEFQNSKVGSFGDLACFSFYPTKNLGAIGDGGGIATNSEDLYLQLKMLRQYGWEGNRNSKIASQVTRLDELQASILRVKLKHLDSNNLKRIALAETYSKLLNPNNIVLPVISPGIKHVFHLYVVRVSNRQKYQNELAYSNIFPGIHYEWPVHLNEAYSSKIGRAAGGLDNTEYVAGTVLSLPMYPELTNDEIGYISEVVNNV